jgi:hypothetical protein
MQKLVWQSSREERQSDRYRHTDEWEGGSKGLRRRGAYFKILKGHAGNNLSSTLNEVRSLFIGY